MPTYRIGQAADLLGVSVDTVRRWVDAGRIASTRRESGHRVLDGAALAEFAVQLAAEGAPDDAADVIVARSARNHFTGIVTRVVTDTVAAQVEIQAGPHRIVSLMTREAVDELGLEPGMLAVATVKSTNVVVEIPRPT
jgi:molybdopterin-binding protein